MSRIFPTKKSQNQMGSEHEFVGIDTARVASLLNTPAKNPNTKLSQELKKTLTKIANHDYEDYEYENEKVASQSPRFNRTKTASKQVEDESPIVFNSFEDINADALRTAEAAGDTRRVRCILAARAEIRDNHFAEIEAKEKQEQEKIAARKETRAKITTAGTKRKEAKAATTVKEEFVSPTKLNTKEAQAFAKLAKRNGFSTDYIAARLANINIPDENTVEDIKKVMASDISLKAKKTAIASMVKESSLDNESLSRLKDYWKNELGYGDPQYIDDWFSAIPSKGKGPDVEKYEGADTNKGE